MVFKHDWVLGARFSRDETRLLTWGGDGTARLWDVTTSEPLMIFNHGKQLAGVQFNRDESLLLTWGLDNTTRLWDTTKSKPLMVFHRDSYVSCAMFTHDESRVLVCCNDGVGQLWDIGSPAYLTSIEKILELEVRSATTLNSNLELRTLNIDEWQEKVQSKEYKAIKAKIQSHSAK